MIFFDFIWLSNRFFVFELILIVGPRLIFRYLMISHFCLLLVSYGLLHILVDFNRRPSPDLRLSYGCMVLYGFPMGLPCFWLILIVGTRTISSYHIISYGLVWFSYGLVFWGADFNRRPSPDLLLSYDFLWCCTVVLWFCNVFG